MAKIRRNIPVDACPDGIDPNSLPLVSPDNEYGSSGSTLTAIVVDGDRAWFDQAALHGRTVLEQRVRWVTKREEVPRGRTVNPVWVYIRPAGQGNFQYYGLVACDMVIDEENGVGYKRLGDHVNRLSKALQGEIDLSLLDARGRQALKEALARYPAVLEHSRDELKKALDGEPTVLTRDR